MSCRSTTSLKPNTGDLIQGNFIGDYFVYLVDSHNLALPCPIQSASPRVRAICCRVWSWS